MAPEVRSLLAETHLKLGRALERLGRGEAARRHYGEAVALAPGCAEAARRLSGLGAPQRLGK